MLVWGSIAITMLVVRQCRKEKPGVFLNDDVEALARVVRSEIGTGTKKEQVHVAWAARNLASEKGVGISKMVCSPCGPQRKGRPLSSAQPALESDRVVARRVLAASLGRDPTGGATHFINPVLQDKLAKEKRRGYVDSSYRVVARRWRRSYGWEPYYRIAATLEMWGPRRKKVRKSRR